ncbi:MAG: hypothetical protein NTV51_14815 [Verrucomicrobia bacterium]|nr:hypothetical protein [Verrucomicrobiota bacterium]
MALLHATVHQAALDDVQVIALHVHHGLSPKADAWLDHVASQCARWARRGLPVAFERLEKIRVVEQPGERAGRLGTRLEPARRLGPARRAAVVYLVVVAARGCLGPRRQHTEVARANRADRDSGAIRVAREILREPADLGPLPEHHHRQHPDPEHEGKHHRIPQTGPAARVGWWGRHGTDGFVAQGGTGGLCPGYAARSVEQGENVSVGDEPPFSFRRARCAHRVNRFPCASFHPLNLPPPPPPSALYSTRPQSYTSAREPPTPRGAVPRPALLPRDHRR